jgi:hypothetical protein
MKVNAGMTHAWILVLAMFFALQGCSTKYTLNAPDYKGYAGEINQHSRIIKADKPHIFEILTTEELFAHLCPEGTIVTFVEPLPYQAGTRVETKIEHIFKLGWNSEVEEVVPYSSIRLRFLDGFFAGGKELWEFEDAGAGTRVTQTIIVAPEGFIRQVFWNTKVRLKHNKMVEVFLDNLKTLAEAK